MTPAEAEIIGAIVNTADSGCSVCVAGLFEELVLRLPGIDWYAAMIDGPHWTADDMRKYVREAIATG